MTGTGSLTVLRVMTWNIRTGVGNDPNEPGRRAHSDLDRIAQVIQAVNPDVVALQEVDRGKERTLGVDQPAVLAGLLGMDYRYGPNLVDDDGEYGIAVLTPHAIFGSHHELLPGADGWEPRGFLDVQIDVPGAGKVNIVNTHLQVAFGEGEVEASRQRQESAAILTQRVMEAGGPALLMGDFNAEPTAVDLAALTGLKDAWMAAGNGEAGHTFPASPFGEPEMRIDAIFVNDHLSVEQCRLRRDATTEQASDHYPVVADLGIVAQ